MNIFSLPIVKRKTIALLFGILFGVLCAWLASKTNPAAFDIKEPLFWAIVYNRVLLAIFVVIFGAFTVHPIFKFRLHPIWRGAMAGAIVSLAMSINTLMSPDIAELEITKIFWGTIIAGSIFGAIIDGLATKFGGEGKELI